MKKGKLPKSKKADIEWQEKIAKSVAKEKVKLDHPQGLERFQDAIRNLGRKDKRL